jgi:two-component system chemotaxis response regulator CheY
LRELTIQIKQAATDGKLSRAAAPLECVERIRAAQGYPQTVRLGLAQHQEGRAAMYTLIVEDDFTSPLLLQTFLSRFGECHVAVNGKEAVEAFHLAKQNGRPYDLICMDIMMPEKDGKAALSEIRALEEAGGTLSSSGVKVIMITALDDVKNVVGSFRALCDAYVFKSVYTAKLLGQLNAFALVP